ncbi:MAG: CoA-disulfide reductase [Firmicutes bacterium]|nr:CoA-disulfide reductase [Bacillota bacterium]
MKIIAIGGVALSMSAVSKLKRSDPSLDIVVYEKGDVFSYGACGMPYYISDEIKDANALIARTKEQFIEQGIKAHDRHEVLSVNPVNHTILVKNLNTNEEFTDSFDKLIIGTGAKAIIPSWKNIALQNIFTLSSFEDSIKIKKRLEETTIKQVTVIGGGFIGIEMVEAFLTRGLEVTLIEYSDHLLNVLDPELSTILEEHLRSKGVTLRLGEKVLGFEGTEKVEQVVTNKGEIHTELVLLSIGIQPNTAFLTGSGIVLSKNGAVEINRKMQTNFPSIYAGGDCGMIYNRSLKENSYLPMGSNANKQGRIIAENILGNEVSFKGVLGTIVIKVVDMEAAKTGLTEKEALKRNISHKTVTVTGKNHASYYPNPMPIMVKVIYDPTTFVILGAELVGYQDTALRINVFALAIQTEMTTQELGFLDLAYAPPFAGVWDVIQVAVNQAK